RLARCVDGAEDEHAPDRRGREHDRRDLRFRRRPGACRRPAHLAARHGAARPEPARRRRRGRAARPLRPGHAGRARARRARRDDRRDQARAGRRLRQGPAGPLLIDVPARLRSYGFSAEDAATLADHFLEAEARGRTGHGLSRVEWLGTLPDLDPAARPEVVVAEGGYERWEGRGAVGYLVLAKIVEAQVADPPDRARLIVAANTFPTGMLGYWVRKLAEGGLVAALTATSPARLGSPAGGPKL